VSGMVDLARRVARQELAGQRSSRLGVVTAVFAHSDKDDGNNYEVSVKLKYEDLELTRVPLVTSHAGFVALPDVGDLVLIGFVDGDINQPIVVGRLYDNQKRAPLFKEDEILFEHRVQDGTLNHLRFMADGSILIQRDVSTREDNSKARTTVRIDGGSGDLEVLAGDKVVLLLKNNSEIQVTCDKMAIQGDVEIDGDLVVSGAAGKTTISGNNITGS
jgi:phage baseplate assembly protein gpV